MCGCHMRKQRFIGMVCDSKSHAMISCRVINIKWNIAKKMTGLVIMTLNREKI